VNRATFMGFEWVRPELALVFIAVPIALAFGGFALSARRRARAQLVDDHQLARFLPGFSPNRALLRVVLAGLSLFFMAVTVLGPVRGYSLREVERRGLDIVICIDTSRSMLVQDLQPSRLERAKREVNGLLQLVGGDRVALVAFSGDVRNVSPLTRDRETVRWFLSSLSPEDNLKGGTDLGAALEHALDLFDGRTGAHEAIVLLTDGEDLEGTGLAAAEQARERGIRVYVVGMGTETGGKIPDPSEGFVRDETGSEVVSALDGTTLAQIADATDGAYLAADDVALPLEEIYNKRIAKLEGRHLQDGKERIPHDRYQWSLVLALACMFAEAAL